MDVDVLVVGAGPVGLAAALQLGRRGVSVRLVDAASEPATGSRALITHARSLEIYDQLGILGDISPHATRVNSFIRHRADRTMRVEFVFDGLATRFPFFLNIEQVFTERVLRGHAASAGVEVEWGTRLESFEQDADGVTATVRAGGAEGAVETVRARYLWGCDGGHSTVRKLLGLRLEGESTHTWLSADATVHADLERDGVHWMFPDGGALMAFPLPDPGRWRLLDTTGEGDPDDREQIARQFTSKLSQALARDIVVEVPPAGWVSKFTIQQRAVPAMHVGRCFVSGDAAHVHSPASGQGLNSGVQDAYNLAWKLAMVVRGDADPVLLDTYDIERVPIGRALLASTREVMDVITVDAPSGDTRDADRTFMPQLVRNMSGLGVAYPDSPLTAPDHHRGKGPRPGHRLTQINASDAQSPGWTALRARLRAVAWHLLVFDEHELIDGHVGGVNWSAPPWLSVVPIGMSRPTGNPSDVWDPDGRVHETLAADAGDWILVRPDGYISARGTRADDPRAVLDRLVGLRTLTGAGAA